MGGPPMHRYPAGTGQLAELDAMIARAAEAACGRYRRAAEQPGLTPLAARMRRDARRAMIETLARLQAQREAAIERMMSFPGSDPADARHLGAHLRG
jgi:hypothetical protein